MFSPRVLAVHVFVDIDNNITHFLAFPLQKVRFSLVCRKIESSVLHILQMVVAFLSIHAHVNISPLIMVMYTRNNKNFLQNL